MKTQTLNNFLQVLNKWEDVRDLFIILKNGISYWCHNVIILNTSIIFTTYSSQNTRYFKNIWELKEILYNTNFNWELLSDIKICVEHELFIPFEIAEIYNSIWEVIIKEKSNIFYKIKWFF
jgi:hypothetical protein